MRIRMVKLVYVNFIFAHFAIYLLSDRTKIFEDQIQLHGFSSNSILSIPEISNFDRDFNAAVCLWTNEM